MLARQDVEVVLACGEISEGRGVPLPGRCLLACLGQAAGGVLADGLQQLVSGPAAGAANEQQGFGCQRVDHIKCGRVVSAAAHCGDRRQLEAAGENRKLG